MAEESGITSAIRAIVNGIQKVVDKLDGFIDWIFELVPRFFKSLVIILQDFFLWSLEQVFGLVKALIDGITGMDEMVAKLAGIWAGVPPEVTLMMQTIGLGTAFGIIVAAIGIRLVLQLIPFTRLGS
ncbi:DUF2523 domain-containing protein [Acidovorax sp. SUPP3434]|uniref:DUF2523 family protein n=1 Tax=Acidovorax sp. SUPP3434 TaxID=2920880 RepID=UPI0023DE3668|nr:DUF2523 family protein [Acidovorax sp. SUPP3434]GKT02283.1 DUF2523 domain-containing protein [Acidovorax sp. SUPP3434]